MRLLRLVPAGLVLAALGVIAGAAHLSHPAAAVRPPLPHRRKSLFCLLRGALDGT